MARKVIRKIELFALHAHDEDDVSYEEIFANLASIDRKQRVIDISGVVIGFPIVRKQDGGYFLQVTEGDPDATALVFNRRTGETREASLGDAEILSQATHLFVVPLARRATVEYVRRGIKAALIAAAIEGLIRANFKSLHNLRLEFASVPAESFVKGIREFERIRMASIRLTKPNASWTDHYTNLSEFMEESNGEKVEVDVRAGRQGSLAKTKGIVQTIKDVAEDGQPYLDEATIVGTRANETNETTLRATHHVEHVRATINADEAGGAEPQSIRKVLVDFMQRWI